MIARPERLLYLTARLRCSEVGSALCFGLTISPGSSRQKTLKCPLRREFIWTRRLLPALEPIGLTWATFQVMRRTFASRAKEAGVDAHTRSAQMGNTVDVNENEYAVSDFKTRCRAVRKLEAAVTVQ